ncbi:DUF349 domain-containing protein, partial [Bifidobacterium sp. 6T3]|nr:DUF349 domain-containing protein [Bifidobacterium phasiani]
MADENVTAPENINDPTAQATTPAPDGQASVTQDTPAEQPEATVAETVEVAAEPKADAPKPAPTPA